MFGIIYKITCKESGKVQNSIVDGYNIAVGGEGGNTYAGRSKEEMEITKKKIGAKNFGRNNGMSHQIKCKSIATNEELFFESLNQCLRYFGIKNKGIVMDRVNGKNKTLWHREWLFAKENEEYTNFEDDAFSRSRCRGTPVILKKDNETKNFPSKNLALKFLGLQKGALINGAIINGWTISF